MLYIPKINRIVFNVYFYFRPIQDIADKLKPLFEMDLYLPRSFVACLKLIELQSVAACDWLPIEVVCAAMLHWVKTSKYSTSEMKVCCKYLIYMLHDMTKPALMTFSNIEAINFDFNAKLTDFAMFSYRFNIWLTYYPIYRDYKTHIYLLVLIP